MVALAEGWMELGRFERRENSSIQLLDILLSASALNYEVTILLLNIVDGRILQETQIGTSGYLNIILSELE